MEITSVCWCLLLAGCLQLATGDSLELTPTGVPEEPPKAASADLETDRLFLTPLIEACNFSEAKEKSNVIYFKQYGVNATAHSGYITVNETTKNHLFFLLIQAEENPNTAPLMLWTQGGPGLSALFGLLLQNGPLSFEYGKSFSRRDLTIQKHVNMIYLDAPVGAGFSFTENQTGYPKLLPDVITDIKEFLRQFLELFSEYKERDFYIGGDSYAARYAVGLAQYMLMNQQELNLTLQGIIGGVGFLAPIFELADSSEFLLQASMLDANGYNEYKKQFIQMRQFATSKNQTLIGWALHTLFNTIFTSTPKTLFQNLTLYNDHASPLHTERPLSMIFCVLHVNSSEFKTAIHAGVDSSIQYANPLLLTTFAYDWLVDITTSVEFVLNYTRVLFYSGQIDTLFPSPNLQGYFETLNWTYKETYACAERTLWRPDGTWYDGAGYMKSAGNFTSMVMIGMSHYAGFDKPVETYHLMKQFIEGNISLSPSEEYII